MATPTNVHYSRPNVGPIAGGRTVFGAPAAAQAGASASLAIAKAMAAAATGVMLVTGNVAHSVPLAASAQAVAAATAALTVAGSGPYLEAQAAALLPGRWVELTGMGGFTWSLIASPNGSGFTILDFGGKGMVDQPGGRLSFFGGAHPGTDGLINYAIASNLWSTATPPFTWTDGHSWDGEASDPATGDCYIYQKTSGRFWRRVSGAITWTEIASVAPLGTEETVGLTWDEQRGGTGGLLVWSDQNGVDFWAKSAGAGTWAHVGDPGASGPNCMAARYMRNVNKSFLTDGGNDPTGYWILNGSSFGSKQHAAFNVFTAGSGGQLLEYHHSSGRIVWVNPVTNAMTSYNPSTGLFRSFTPSNGAIPFNRPSGGTDGFVISIEYLDVLMYVQGQGSGAAPKGYLFKHTRAPILPAVITFSAPGSIDVAPYCENYNASTTLLSLPPGTPGTVSISGSILSSSVAQTLTNLYLQETPI